MDYEALVGQRFGPGKEVTVHFDRVRKFRAALAIDDGSDRVPVLLVVALLPALATELPLPPPKTSINYGLNRLTELAPVELGDRLQATYTISSIESSGSSLQVARLFEVVANAARPVVVAETLSRLLY